MSSKEILSMLAYKISAYEGLIRTFEHKGMNYDIYTNKVEAYRDVRDNILNTENDKYLED